MSHLTKGLMVLSVCLGGLTTPIYAQQKVTNAADAPWVVAQKVENGNWHGFKVSAWQVKPFTLQIAEPLTPAPGRPWVLMLGEIGDGFHWQLTEMMLKQGMHVAAVNSYNTYGSDYGLSLMDSLYALARKHFDLPGKCGLVGVSRAGLSVYRWTIKHPDRVACIYCEGPVLDFKTWPMKWPPSAANWTELKQYYGFASDAEALAYPGNPIDNLQPIAQAQIPLRHIISLTEEHDIKIVPNELNTLKAQQLLQTMGHDLDIVVTPKGDTVPYASDSASIAFLLTNCQKEALRTNP